MSLQCPKWERDVVYLIQYPRTKFIPTISPFSLKVETWLRMADLKYENMSNNLTTTSAKGQIPFIELNGAQINDSDFIIHSLTEIFHTKLESHLSGAEKAIALAFEQLIEQSLHFTLLRQRADKVDELMLNGLMENANIFIKMVQPIASLKVSRNLDATAFGMLCQFWFLPTGSETKVRKFMASDTQNLVEYIERMKYNYWPDWDTACRELRLDTDWKIDVDGIAKLQDASQ